MVVTKTLYVVAGDYGYDVPFTLEDYNGDVVDLTGYSGVKLKVADTLTAATCNLIGTCSVVDEDAGSVSYTVANGDFSTAGVYPAEIEVTFDSKILTFRNLEIKIYDQLANTDS